MSASKRGLTVVVTEGLATPAGPGKGCVPAASQTSPRGSLPRTPLRGSRHRPLDQSVFDRRKAQRPGLTVPGPCGMATRRTGPGGLPWPVPRSDPVVWTSCADLCVQGMCPRISVSTCPAASPCTRLSRAPSTISGSDVHRRLCSLLVGPFSRQTRPSHPLGQDDGGSPRCLDASLAVRAVLRDPAGGSGTLVPPAADGCPPRVRPWRPPDGLTRLHRVTGVTARPSLYQRLAPVVASRRSRLDSR